MSTKEKRELVKSIQDTALELVRLLNEVIDAQLTDTQVYTIENSLNELHASIDDWI